MKIIKKKRVFLCIQIETIVGILTEIQRSQEDLLRKRALRMF
jgi:hypothetical protein